MPVIKEKPFTRKYILLLALLLFSAASSLLFSSCSDRAPEPEPDSQTREDTAKQEQEATGTDQQDQEYINGNDLEQENNYQDMEIYPDPELPRIGLYAGRGSWNENVKVAGYFLDHYGFEWSSFDETEAVSLDFAEHYDLLWFPGGFAAEYKNYINDHSNIREFVSDGGLFVGSCAGAYYASDILRWQGTDYEYPLKLFQGKGVGPLAGLIGWGETGTIELAEDHPVNRDFEPEKEMYYFDGPYFEPYDEETIIILARYRVNEEPAVIAGEKGSGKYLLLGPHPEIGGYSEESSEFSREGNDGAQWPWLYQVLLWLTGD